MDESFVGKTQLSANEFLVNYEGLRSRLFSLNPVEYARNRNFLSGDVTRLSPFVSHGVISTKDIIDALQVSYSLSQVEKFIFQLAWRDYFYRVWQAKGNDIFHDLKRNQAPLGKSVESMELPQAIVEANTGIEILDQSIQQLYTTGYLHNHARMWLAAVIANIAKTKWQTGAAWMHYHLLDGDLASNTLSWQWVAGTFSNKCYIANQDNLNSYSQGVLPQQKNTFLDCSYEQLANLVTPDVLVRRQNWRPTLSQQKHVVNAFADLSLSLKEDLVQIDQPIFLHSIYHLSPVWHQSEEGQHILLLEPSQYEIMPLSPLRWAFIRHWALQIPNLKIIIGNFDEIFSNSSQKIVFQDHPGISHWHGQAEPMPFLFDSITEYYPSFFKFWNDAKKQLQSIYQNGLKDQ